MSLLFRSGTGKPRRAGTGSPINSRRKKDTANINKDCNNNNNTLCALPLLSKVERGFSALLDLWPHARKSLSLLPSPHFVSLTSPGSFQSNIIFIMSHFNFVIYELNAEKPELWKVSAISSAISILHNNNNNAAGEESPSLLKATS